MSQIHIEQAYTMPVPQVREQVEVLAGKLRDRFGAETKWNQEALEFSGSGITGAIRIHPGNVVVEADLGFIFGMIKDTVEQEIRRVLSERLY